MCGVVGGCMVDKAESLDIPLTYRRMETDTAKSYEAFVLYRDLGKERSSYKVAEMLAKSDALIRRWSAEHHWVDRAKIWDKEIDGRATKQELMDKQAARIRHMRMLRKQQEFADGQIDKHSELAARAETPIIDADKAAKIGVEAMKGERLVQGDPTERTENTGALDWSNLEADEIIMFKALIVKLKGGKDD
jgi:hypothetical protein